MLRSLDPYAVGDTIQLTLAISAQPFDVTACVQWWKPGSSYELGYFTGIQFDNLHPPLNERRLASICLRRLGVRIQPHVLRFVCVNGICVSRSPRRSKKIRLRRARAF